MYVYNEEVFMIYFSFCFLCLLFWDLLMDSDFLQLPPLLHLFVFLTFPGSSKYVLFVDLDVDFVQ